MEYTDLDLYCLHLPCRFISHAPAHLNITSNGQLWVNMLNTKSQMEHDVKWTVLKYLFYSRHTGSNVLYKSPCHAKSQIQHDVKWTLLNAWFTENSMHTGSILCKSPCEPYLTYLTYVYSGMGNFRINPDFRIENFHFKHEISLLQLFTRPSFCVRSSYLA